MFDFSMLQQMFGGGLGQGLLGQQPQMGQQQPAMPGYGPNMGNPYAMGIPTQPQATAPYTQQSPYTQGSPYTQTGWTPSFQDYFSPFQDLRQQWQDKNNADYAAAQQPQVPPNQGQITSDQLAELYSRTNTITLMGLLFSGLLTVHRLKGMVAESHQVSFGIKTGMVINDSRITY